MRPAARLVQLARQRRSEIWLELDGRVANLRSILSVMGLCAVMGVTLEVEARGDDEDNAIRAVEAIFADDADAVSGVNEVADTPGFFDAEVDPGGR